MKDHLILQRIIKNDPDISWLHEQTLEIFSRGVTKNVKDSDSDDKFAIVEPKNITQKSKREKYETTRAYTDEEKLEILLLSIQKIFVEVPAFQQSAIISLEEFAGKELIVEFTPPEELEEGFVLENTHTIKKDKDHKNKLKEKYDRFIKEYGDRT